MVEAGITPRIPTDDPSPKPTLDRLTAEFEGLKLSIQDKDTRDEAKHRGTLEAIQSIGKAVEECNKQLPTCSLPKSSDD